MALFKGIKNAVGFSKDDWEHNIISLFSSFSSISETKKSDQKNDNHHKEQQSFDLLTIALSLQQYYSFS
jgi:hypothetical protein